MVDTATGFVLGALIGAVATMAGSYFVYWRRQQARTGRLRLALLQELSSLDYVEELAGEGAYEHLTETVRRPVVYEESAGQLGYLTDEEVRALVGFYGGLYWLDGQEDIEDKKDAVHDLVEERRSVIELLESNR